MTVILTNEDKNKCQILIFNKKPLLLYIGKLQPGKIIRATFDLHQCFQKNHQQIPK